MQVVAAILVYKNNILAFRRPISKSNQFISLKYEFPGGKIKKNETDIVALNRELKEELEVNISEFIQYFSTSFKYPDKEVHINFYLSIIKNLKFKMNAHVSYKLVSINNLRTLDWLDADYALIDYIEKKGFPKELF